MRPLLNTLNRSLDIGLVFTVLGCLLVLIGLYCRYGFPPNLMRGGDNSRLQERRFQTPVAARSFRGAAAQSLQFRVVDHGQPFRLDVF